MKKMTQTIAFFLLTVCSIACNEQKTEQKAPAHEGISQTTLNIPSEIDAYTPFENYLMDSTGIASASLKVYISINLSCPTCVAKLNSWKTIAKELSKEKVPLILVGYADDKFELIKYLCKNKAVIFPYPIFLDKTGTFVSKNKIISESGELNAVLTDQNNRILTAGDILNIPEAKAAFFKKIKSHKS